MKRVYELLHPSVTDGTKAIALSFNSAGLLLLDEKRPEDGVRQFRKALEHWPDWPEAQSNLGKALLDLGRLEEAEAALRRALHLDSSNPVTQNRIGTLLRIKGAYAEAENHFREAIRLKEDFADAYNNLGTVLSEQGKAAEAEESFRAAIGHAPNHAMAWCNLGLALSNKGLQEQTENCFLRALYADPTYFYPRITLVMNKLLEIYEDESEIEKSRRSYQKALEELVAWVSADEVRIADAAEAIGWVTPFFLAYQGRNDRDLQSLYGRFICAVMASHYPALALPPPRPAIEGGKPLRIGVVSGFFFDHSVWKTPIQGWIENLDRSRFQIYGYYTRTQQDAATAAARRVCHQFVEGLAFDALADRIRADALHVLIFPEIGMDPATVKLASLRLAPVQCTSWGHPITSGMPTIDYYLSSDLMEPAEAEGMYTEKLVRLPNLSVHYTPPAYPARSPARRELGLRDNAVVYLCAQSLYKYLPQFDIVFARTARQVPDSQFVFFASQHSTELTEKFRRRIERTFAKEGIDSSPYVLMLPRSDNATFQAIARISDIFLDSIEWSGCNTTLESMVCGLPAITCKGAAMRGRHTYAFLKMMEFDELIAEDVTSYIALAVRLGKERAWREQIRSELSVRLPRLFGDMACVRGLAAFLWKAAN